MTAAEILSPEAEKSVAQIVRQDLEHIMTEGISINEVRTTPGEDQDGDPYYHIVVVYSGNGDLLDPAWLNGFKRRNREVLAKWGVHLTTESYVEVTEDSEWSELSNVPYYQG
jgi:hypothetical protein